MPRSPTSIAEEDDPAIILYTSGTTGRPKGAINTHRNLSSYLMLNFFSGAADCDAHTRRPSDAAEAVPADHEPALPRVGLAQRRDHDARDGHEECVADGPLRPRRLSMQVIERERCTGWSFTETVLHRLVNHPDVGKYDLSSVRTVGGGGSPIAPSLLERTRKVFPNARTSLGIGYGQTECAALATLNNGQELIDLPDVGGAPAADGRARDPRSVRQGSSRRRRGRGVRARPDGHARLLAPARKQPPRRSRPGGWLRTGDIGRMEGGRLYLASRKRDLIFRGGENVYPVEIEKRIEDHPDVEECAVIGVDHPELGQSGQGGARPAAAATPSMSSRSRVVRGDRARVLQGPRALGGPDRAAAAQRGRARS